jgi:DNA-binding transcriptional LysR family regulator
MILKVEVDIAVINNAPSNRSLTLEPYRREPVAAFVSGNHPLSKKGAPTWRDLDRTPLIIRKPLGGRSTAQRLLRLIRAKGLKPKVSLRCDSPDAVKAAVKRKMGLGILFKETVEPEVRKGEFKIIKLPGFNLEGQSFIAYRKDRPLSPLAQDFLELLRSRRYKSRSIAAAMPGFFLSLLTQIALL